MLLFGLGGADVAATADLLGGALLFLRKYIRVARYLGGRGNDEAFLVLHSRRLHLLM